MHQENSSAQFLSEEPQPVPWPTPCSMDKKRKRKWYHMNLLGKGIQVSRIRICPLNITASVPSAHLCHRLVWRAVPAFCLWQSPFPDAVRWADWEIFTRMVAQHNPHHWALKRNRAEPFTANSSCTESPACQHWGKWSDTEQQEPSGSSHS